MLLFDTNILIPWLAGDALPKPLIERVCEEGAFVSVISIWEIWIKVRIGKLEMKTDNLVKEVDAAQLSWLSVLPGHAEAVRDLPLLHRDPFDRLLLAQAKAEGAVVVTMDRIFSEYLPDAWVV